MIWNDHIPWIKPPTGTKKWEQLEAEEEDIWQAKLDGAFLYLTFDKEDGVRAFSYRRSKRDGQPIEHTNKIYGLRRISVPDYLDGAVLSGEAWHPDLASREVGGILNTRKQELPESLFVALHGIDRMQDYDVATSPFRQQIEVLKKIQSDLPMFDLPDTAYSREEKRELYKKIKDGKHPQTREGIIVYPESGKPYKTVIEPSYDVPVVGTTPGLGKHQGKGIGAILVGGPENPTRVGTGLSNQLRKVLHENPELIDGLIARVKAKEVFPSGKMRAPVLMDFHPEKSDPDNLNRIKDLVKTADREFAPGIPFERIIQPIPEVEGKWEFAVQEHDAHRAGKHYDLRLGDPDTGFAHSWALPKAILPDQENRVRLAIHQPTHTMDYMDFEGIIPEGYGAGEVKMVHRDSIDVRAEPDRLHFNIPEHGDMVLLQRDGSQWIIIHKRRTQ